MKRLSLGWAAAALLGLAVVLLAAGWNSAAKDPYQAAERFLQGQGLDVIRTQDLRSLTGQPPAALSLMLLGERERMSPSQAQALLAWVYAGGRLLVTTHGFWVPGGSGDPLLDPLNIRLLNAYASAGVAPVAARSTLTQLYLESQDAPLLLGFAPGRHLEDADNLAQSWANSPQGTHMLQLNLGAGTLTVVSDTKLWRDSAIGQFDNAWLLWYLNQGRQVVMQYRRQALSAAPLLGAHPATLGYSLILLVLIIWYGATRRSCIALRAAARPVTPTIGLHQQVNRAHLLRGLREEIQRCADRRQPGFGQKPVAEQWQLIAKWAGIPTASVALALRPYPGTRIGKRAFAQQVARLQAIRNAL